MQETEFKALKEDMKAHGPQEIDPLLVSPYLTFYPCQDTEENRKLYAENPIYVIVDGEHRWNTAIELEWSDIPCEIRELSEEDAKGICYRKNKDRGTIDPFKEADLFKSELKAGLKQAEIAEKYIVDPSTVSHRLSLLKLVPEVKKQVEQLPRGTITTSHLEPIAALPEGEQKKIKLKDEWGHQEVKSVRVLTEEARRIKERLAEKEALQKALKAAKFPKCPKCGNEPGCINGRKLPWVDCSSGDWSHIWNLDTGKGPYEEEKAEQRKINGEKSEPIRTSVLRCAHSTTELSKTFNERIKELFPKIQTIQRCNISAKLEDGKEVSVDFSPGKSSMSVSLAIDHKHYASFRAEEKEYRSGEKSKVDTYAPDNVEPIKEFIELSFAGKFEVPEKKPKEEKTKVPTSEEVAANTHEEQVETDLELPCFDCAYDHENGGKCHRSLFVTQDGGGYTCTSKVQLSGEELAKKGVDAELSKALGQ